MAKGNKKPNAFVGILVTLFLVFAFLPAIIRSIAPEKHPLIDTWYIDETECFADAPELIIEAEKAFYDKTGIQPVVYVTTQDNRKNTSSVYHDLFDDEEHILIYIVEYKSHSEEFVYTEIPSLDNPEESREYLYEITEYSNELYVGNDSLNDRELQVLRRNLTLADIDGEFGAYDLATVIYRAGNQIDRSSPSSMIYTVIETIKTLIPILLFISVVVIIVRIANKASNKVEYSPNPTSLTPTEASKSVDSEKTKTKPIWETTLEKPDSSPTLQTTITPKVVPESTLEAASEAAPVIETKVEPETTTDDNQMFDIKPIEPIKIEPISFDLNANNILGDTNDITFDTPNVIDTNIDTNFDDWGNI